MINNTPLFSISSVDSRLYTYRDLTWRTYPHPADSYKKKLKWESRRSVSLSSLITLSGKTCWGCENYIWGKFFKLSHEFHITQSPIKVRELSCKMNQQICLYPILFILCNPNINRPRKPKLIYSLISCITTIQLTGCGGVLLCLFLSKFPAELTCLKFQLSE